MKLKRAHVKTRFHNLSDRIAKNESLVVQHCMGPNSLSQEEVKKLVSHYLIEDFRHSHIVDAVTNIIYHRWQHDF